MNLQINKIFRYLRKNATFTTINILGLAFGFTCALLIILHVKKEYSYNTSIPENERVFFLLEKSPRSTLGNTSISYALTPLLGKHYPEIEYYARTENYAWFSNCIVSYQSQNSNEIRSFNESSFYIADNDVFNIFQYPFVEGKSENCLNEPGSIVLSKNTAERYFGNEPALGKTLVLNDEHSFTVSGVVEFPDYTTFQFSMLAPMTTLRSESKLASWNSNGQPYFKLHENVNYKEFNNKIEHFYSELKPENIRNPEELTLTMQPIKDRRLYYNKRPLNLLIFMGFVILTVSILNYVIISTSLVQKRNQEIALKKISGAGKRLIGYEFILETAFVCLFAILISMLTSFIGTSLFHKLTGSEILPFLKSSFSLFVKYSVLLWLSISLIAGFYPAMILSGMTPLSAFRKEGKKGTSILGKNVMVTFQFVVSIVLVIFTLMVNRQYNFMKEMPLGFDSELVMEIPFNDKLKNNYINLKDELKKIPTVHDVCAASAMPAGIPNHSGVTWTDDNNVKHEETFAFAIVTDGYTQTFGMHMLQGEEFTMERQENLNGIIVNKQAALRLGYENPIGKQIEFWGKQNTIIGVVKDFQNNYLFNAVKPMVMSAHPNNQGFTKHLYVSLLHGDLNQTTERIEKIVTNISPGFPFEYRFTNAEVDSYINEIKQLNSTFNFAGIVAIILAVIGLVALTYHSTLSRIKEVGIRKVNGAKNIEVMSLLNSTYFKCIIIAYIIACPIAWIIINNLLQGIANRVSITWWVFALGGLIALVVATLTVSWQSYRAANRNPVEALRYE